MILIFSTAPCTIKCKKGLKLYLVNLERKLLKWQKSHFICNKAKSVTMNKGITSLLNPFVPNAPFLYLLKTSENRKFFWYFQGLEKGCIGNEWVNGDLSRLFSSYSASYFSKKNDSKLIFRSFFRNFHIFLSLNGVRKIYLFESIDLFILKCTKNKLKAK